MGGHLVTDTRPDPAGDIPHRARMWNYWLGGKDHYAADRNSADAISAAYPAATELVRATHRFGERVVRHLAAEHGVRQFVDIGTGLPADRDLHAVLRDIAPDAHIVHLDHDPFVLVRARALPLRSDPHGAAVYHQVDFRDPAAVLAAAATELDLRQPVAVLFMGLLGYLPSPGHAQQAVRGVLDGLAPGSFLAVWEGSATSDGVRAGATMRAGSGGGYRLSTAADFAELFAGLELLEPGVAPVTEWLTDDEAGATADAYGGIARLTGDGTPAAAPEAAPPAGDDPAPPSGIVRTDVPAAPRIWDYLIGGKDHYAADRAVGDAIAATHPRFVDAAVAARRFLVRAVTHIAETGVRQFLDIGSGLPSGRNTHGTAQAVVPEARIVYVDNDPQVIVLAQARLAGTTREGVAAYVQADYREPETLLDRAGAVLDLREPVGVLFMGVLGYVEAPEMLRVVRAVVDALAPGSHLALWDVTDTSPAARAAAAALGELGIPYRLNTVAELQECFTGLEMVEPGLVPVTMWRPGPVDDTWPTIDCYGGIGRTPEPHHEERRS